MVEDSSRYQKGKANLFVPLLTGSGIRVNILEGMASGKTIISTTIGAEGIPLENNESILIANTPDAFAAQFSKCAESEGFYRLMGNNERKLALEKYEIANLGKEMNELYNLLLLRKVSSRK